MKTNPADLQAAKEAAKRLYKKVNFSGGPLQSYQLSSLLNDTYEYLKIPYKPNNRDLKIYTEILDYNKDGQVTQQDLQALAVQYLCGPGVLNQPSSDITNKKQPIDNKNTNNILNKPAQPLTTSNSQKNINNSWQPIANKYNQKSLTNYSSSQSAPTNEKKFNEETLYHLSLTKPIFQKYATEYNTITADRVPGLLFQTYSQLGRKDYKPNQEDVQVWMRLCDQNNDGHVEYDEYCKFVIESMKRSNQNIDK